MPLKPRKPTGRSFRARLACCLAATLLAVMAAMLPGCSCRTETPVERAARIAKEEADREARAQKRAEEERRKQRVVLAPPQALPAGRGGKSLFVKPGHWSAVLQQAEANAEDFDGVVSYQAVGKDGSPLTPPGTPLRLVSRRPLVVARESKKGVDALVYFPPINDPAPKLRAEVSDRRTGDSLQDVAPKLRPLADHQYHFVVFAKSPGSYAFLDALSSVTARLDSRVDIAGFDSQPGRLAVEKNYRVVAVPTDGPPGEAMLPDNALAWTSIAYLLWDGADPTALRPAQREALVDWLNWGGQLIVSGPGSLDLLRGSFLEPLLPAGSSGAREVSSYELEAFESRWGVGERGKELAKKPVWTGIALEPASGSRSLPGLTDLVIERRVGRGRIVVTAVNLSDRRLVEWSRGIENFFNGALLRRPARRFLPRDTFVADDATPPAVEWADGGAPLRVDPLLNTSWRGFVRDTQADPGALAMRLAPATATGSPLPVANATSPGAPKSSPDDFLTLQPAVEPGGAGAVNDFSLVPAEARAQLRKSAGVSVPGAGFVLGCLAIYLIAVVPLNWALFAAIGRVELAWIAAPLLALVGAWVVVEQARLDIGFVRSRIELGVLELQPNTPRGLLTRYTALYTSLSSVYTLEFDHPAVAAPFPRSSPDEESLLGSRATVAYERLEKARLRDLSVASASTEFVVSEEMFDVASAAAAPGSSVAAEVRLAPGPSGAPRLENRTGWTLEDIVVVRRPDGLAGEPRLEGCWIGDLPPGAAGNVAYLPIPPTTGDELPFAPERIEAAKLRRAPRDAQRLELDGLARLALDPARFEPGETRCVARVSQVLPGLAIEPASSQQHGATLVVAALGYGPLPAPRPDANGPLDVN